MTSNPGRARLSEILDDLEYHRAFGVAARLESAVQAEQQPPTPGSRTCRCGPGSSRRTCSSAQGE